MNKKIHSVKFNFVMNAILTVSSFIFPLITFPYASRVLQVSSYGHVSFAQSVISYFVLISALGIPTYGIRACAKVRDDKEALSKTVFELLLIQMIATVVTYVMFFLFLFVVPDFYKDRDLLLINSLSIILNTIGVQWLFSALEQYSYITVRNIAFKVVMIIMMFIFVHNPKDYLAYALIAVVGSSASNILNFIYMFKFVDFKSINKIDLLKHLKPTFIFFASTAAINIYTSLDSVMLGFLTNNFQVGLYTAAIRLKSCLVGLVNSLGTVLMPRMSYYISKGLNKEYSTLLSKSFNFIIIISLPITVFFVLFSKDFLLFLSGDGYVDATVTMQIVILTLVFIGLSTTVTNQVLIPKLMEKQACFAVWCSAIVDFVLNLLFIPTLGAVGAALATLLAEMISLIIQAFFVRKLFVESIKQIDFFKIIFSLCVSFICVLFIKKILNISLFFNLCIFGIAFFGIYFFALVILREKLVYTIYEEIIISVKSKLLHFSK